MVNSMSALSSSFTILFLFWTLTLLARKLVSPGQHPDRGQQIVIFGSALVGSLAYTFSDSFWFSAVEGEVYAMSSFFTALVFWAMLRWEAMADERGADRWLILIAYLIGLSIGVHLLDLLAIPAIAFIYYFKKYPVNSRGIVLTLIISVLLLALTLYGIIPWIVKLAGFFELFFVNVIGFPFDVGTVIYFLLLTAGILLGLRYAIRRQRQLLYSSVLAFTFLLIGYSSFFLLIIRSNANTPIDENNPENAIALLAYLNREQYGSTPLFRGPYFNAPVVDRKDGSPVYAKDRTTGKYVIKDARKGNIPVYDPRFVTIFPRMWNSQSSSYERNYREWSEMKGKPLVINGPSGQETVYVPTFRENLRYFFRYQLNYMYFRYFMWNFAGRQNDRQGFGGPLDGNWISGIPFIDQARLGPRDNLPESQQGMGRNQYYLLPLLLGLAGLFYQSKHNYRDALVVALLFAMTGIAIVIYLNQHAYQPRERDYAYAASFYAFAIWIGLGVAGIWKLLQKALRPAAAGIVATGVCLIAVPGIMASENWDDHDRSGRYTALETAINYLNSCDRNAILFTNGDNDTFPLWYAQEVEGIRTDVRVVNLSLLNTDWYIDQLLRKAYDSDPVPFSLTWDQYKNGTRDITYIMEREGLSSHVDLRELFHILHNQPERLTMQTQMGPLDVFPSRRFRIPVDSAKVVANGTVKPEDAHLIEKELVWTVEGSAIQKNSLMVLDLLAHFNWERPVYFSTTTGEDAYVGLTDYFQVEGLAFRLVPIKAQPTDEQFGRIHTGVMFDNLMNRFRVDMKDPDKFMGNDHQRMAMNLRNTYGRLARELARQGEADKAKEVCSFITRAIPDVSVPFDYFMIPIAEAWYACGEKEEAEAILGRLLDRTEQDLRYFFRFPARLAPALESDKRQALAVLNGITETAGDGGSTELADNARASLTTYYGLFIGQPGAPLPEMP